MDVQTEVDPTSKLMEYMKAVKYKPPTDAGSFRLALANGTRDVVYSLLKWLLSQVPVLQRRATIGIYLTMPEVPVEYRGIQVEPPPVSINWHAFLIRSCAQPHKI